jgi:hypothetical protein
MLRVELGVSKDSHALVLLDARNAAVDELTAK